ncbi:carboxymuconolactone decarboxylase family protein [Paludisphaera sp.]|uniref:carboxymuconolactone decarboxylase family protein n=1 Tax=Paludisphaera sp. TaxID=2017432 RepID=UPI00301BDF76
MNPNRIILGLGLAAAAFLSSARADGDPAVSIPTDQEAWKKLPEVVSGGGGVLPVWAKAVVERLPRTAAAMLELDYAQRAKSPVDPKLRAAMRWVIARDNRCDYSEAYALADARRAGMDEETIAAVTGDPSGWPADYRDALEFARLHTVDAPSIPDALFARLVERYGEKPAAAMVLLGAYGNFQDRVVLGLSLAMEPTGPLEPIAVTFAPGTFQSRPVMPPQPELKPLRDGGETVVERDPEWSELSYETLQSRLEGQRAREPRLRVPTWDEVKPGLPPEFAQRPTRIVWNLVGMGYVPELAVPWSRATRTMWAETEPDRVFEESLFWVQTRAIRCNYCMGHCEMLLEVAGLDKDAIADRTRRLAGDDWSAFPPEEQRAYAYARKLTKTPWALTPADYKGLEADLGPDAAMATFWWLCRGLYMTRVSDGFALPLERDNVFMDFYGPNGPGKK